MFKLSLQERQRHARNKRAQYRRDAEYRLSRINAQRARAGRQLASSLDEVELRIEQGNG